MLAEIAWNHDLTVRQPPHFSLLSETAGLHLGIKMSQSRAALSIQAVAAVVNLLMFLSRCASKSKPAQH